MKIMLPVGSPPPSFINSMFAFCCCYCFKEHLANHFEMSNPLYLKVRWRINGHSKASLYVLPEGRTSLVAQMVKHLPTVRETWVQSLGQEDLLEKKMATHSSILAWRIPWTEEHGRLQSIGSQRVRHNWATSLSFTLYSLNIMKCIWPCVGPKKSIIRCVTFKGPWTSWCSSWF